ncbi:MAG: hypothetical protein LBJ63_12095 [Prevotellaceae bacterium]|jgi:hypothetical protein|nr:hypothetical protein [Prevotellaceae bacterium]
MKNKIINFAVSYILIGGRIRLYAAGFFIACALLYIYGFATPCGALMRPFADKVYDNGKCGTVFYFRQYKTILSVMSYTEKNASRAKHSSAASTPTERNAVQAQTPVMNNNVEQFLIDLEKLKRRTISESTMNFLVCMKILTMLHGQFSGALREIYDCKYAGEIMEGKFYDVYRQVLDVIIPHLGESIEERLNEINGTEI